MSAASASPCALQAEYLFPLLAVSSGSISGRAIYSHLTATGLPATLLAQIWQMCDTQDSGSIQQPGLTLLLRLVSHATNAPPSSAGALDPRWASTQEQFKAILPTIPLPPLTSLQVARFNRIFSATPQPVSAPGLAAILAKSKLPTSDIQAIVAACVTPGVPVSALAFQNCMAWVNDKMEYGPRLAISKTEEGAQRFPGLLPGPSSMPQIQSQMTGQIQPQMTGQQPQPQQLQQQPVKAQITGISQQLQGQPWAVTAQDKQSADTLWATLTHITVSSVELVDPGSAVEFMRLSKLSEDDLAKIWDLSDIRKLPGLDHDEFAIAVKLIYRTISGTPLFETLPADWVPPALRAQPQPAQRPAQQSHLQDLISIDDVPWTPVKSQLTGQSQSYGSPQAAYPNSNFMNSNANVMTSSPTARQMGGVQRISAQYTGDSSAAHSQHLQNNHMQSQFTGDNSASARGVILPQSTGGSQMQSPGMFGNMQYGPTSAASAKSNITRDLFPPSSSDAVQNQSQTNTLSSQQPQTTQQSSQLQQDLLGDEDEQGQKLEALNLKNAISKANIQPINAAATQLRSSRDQLMQQIAAAEQEESSLRSQLERARSDYEKEQKSLTEVQDKLTRALDQVEDVRRDVISTSSSLSALREERSQVEKGLMQARQDRRALEIELEESVTHAKRQQSALDSRKSELEALQQENAASTERLAKSSLPPALALNNPFANLSMGSSDNSDSSRVIMQAKNNPFGVQPVAKNESTTMGSTQENEPTKTNTDEHMISSNVTELPAHQFELESEQRPDIDNPDITEHVDPGSLNDTERKSHDNLEHSKDAFKTTSGTPVNLEDESSEDSSSEEEPETLRDSSQKADEIYTTTSGKSSEQEKRRAAPPPPSRSIVPKESSSTDLKSEPSTVTSKELDDAFFTGTSQNFRVEPTHSGFDDAFGVPDNGKTTSNAATSLTFDNAFTDFTKAAPSANSSEMKDEFDDFDDLPPAIIAEIHDPDDLQEEEFNENATDSPIKNGQNTLNKFGEDASSKTFKSIVNKPPSEFDRSDPSSTFDINAAAAAHANQATDSESKARPASPAEETDSSDIKQLTGMGFGRSQAVEALKSSNNDVAAALERLL